MSQYYFAYGSNLPSLRLRLRCPSAKPVCVGLLMNYRLVFNMRSVDGSAKANIAPMALGRVMGVVYQLAEQDWPALDKAESGYHRREVQVSTPQGTLTADTYIARTDRITRQRRPYRWYHDLVLAGVQEHQIPVSWRLQLRKQAHCHDPFSRRSSKIRILLARIRLEQSALR